MCKKEYVCVFGGEAAKHTHICSFSYVLVSAFEDLKGGALKFETLKNVES